MIISTCLLTIWVKWIFYCYNIVITLYETIIVIIVITYQYYFYNIDNSVIYYILRALIIMWIYMQFVWSLIIYLSWQMVLQFYKFILSKIQFWPFCKRPTIQIQNSIVIFQNLVLIISNLELAISHLQFTLYLVIVFASIINHLVTITDFFIRQSLSTLKPSKININWLISKYHMHTFQETKSYIFYSI